MNILIQNNNNKFIQNIAITKIDNINIYKSNILGNLYQLYYENKINILLINASLVTDEIRQYIAEFFQSVKIFIYHDRIDKNLIEEHNNTCIHLVHDDIRGSNIIQVPRLVNDDLYMYTDNEPAYNKSSNMVCFLDNLDNIPDQLKKLLYPYNKKLKIKLFNNPTIHHPQNLGILSETDKANILNNNEYFIALDDSYVFEALYKNCKVLALDEVASLSSKQYTQITDHSTYKIFLQSLLNL